MTATVIAIAEAVKEELNSASFSQPLVAARHYSPSFELAEMSTLKVSVVPRSINSKALDRGRDSFEYRIDVAIQKRTEQSLTILDELMQLVEEVADHLRQSHLPSLPDVRCVEVANVPIYSSEHLQELRQFTSLLTLTYRKYR